MKLSTKSSVKSTSFIALLLALVGVGYGAAQDGAGDRMLAFVNTRAITLSDARDEVRFRRLQGTSDAELGIILEVLVDRALLLENQPRRITLPDGYRDRIKSLANRWRIRLAREYGGAEILEEALQELDWSMEEFQSYLENRVESNMQIQRSIRRRVEKPSDAEVEKFKRQLEARGEVTASYGLSQIFFAYPPNLTEGSPERRAVWEEALEVLGKSEEGEPFGLLARDYSDDEFTARYGGVMGDIPEKNLRPEILAAISKLEIGGVSMPIKGEDGIRLIKLERRRTAESMLMAKRVAEVRTELLEELRKRYTVRIIDPELKQASEK